MTLLTVSWHTNWTFQCYHQARIPCTWLGWQDCPLPRWYLPWCLWRCGLWWLLRSMVHWLEAHDLSGKCIALVLSLPSQKPLLLLTYTGNDRSYCYPNLACHLSPGRSSPSVLLLPSWSLHSYAAASSWLEDYLDRCRLAEHSNWIVLPLLPLSCGVEPGATIKGFSFEFFDCLLVIIPVLLRPKVQLVVVAPLCQVSSSYHWGLIDILMCSRVGIRIRRCCCCSGLIRCHCSGLVCLILILTVHSFSLVPCFVAMLARLLSTFKWLIDLLYLSLHRGSMLFLFLSLLTWLEYWRRILKPRL